MKNTVLSIFVLVVQACLADYCAYLDFNKDRLNLDACTILKYPTGSPWVIRKYGETPVPPRSPELTEFITTSDERQEKVNCGRTTKFDLDEKSIVEVGFYLSPNADGRITISILENDYYFVPLKSVEIRRKYYESMFPNPEQMWQVATLNITKKAKAYVEVIYSGNPNEYRGGIDFIKISHPEICGEIGTTQRPTTSTERSDNVTTTTAPSVTTPAHNSFQCTSTCTCSCN